MNVTKNKLIEALNYLGEFPKTSLKKDELIEKLDQIYDKDIEKLLTVINIKIYNLIKKLIKSNEKGIDVEIEYEPEVYFLEDILVIDEPIIDSQKIHIKFNEGMREKFIKLVSNGNENKMKKNQEIVDLIINIVDVYGIIEDYKMLEILNKLLNIKMDMVSLMVLITSQIDLRREIIVAESEDETYFMNELVKMPEEIIAEREKRDLDYKKYTIKELKECTLDKLIERNESKAVLGFLEKKKIKFAEEILLTMILYIMNIPKIDIEDFKHLINIDLKNIDEANEYLQLVINLHNNIPQYSLYGYTPMDLVKMQIEQQNLEEKKRKKSKIGRNDPCPCGSGKKYKNCCLNKVVQVDFKHKKHEDCIEEEDSKMFFALKNLLFDYTNQKYNINPELEDLGDICNAEPEEIKEIREKVWNDSSVIKDYIKENPNELNHEMVSTIEEWNKKKINKEFILYKYEDKYALFMDDDNIYYVKGLKESIRNMIPEQKLPMFVKTVLLPLKNQIIYDSFIEQFNMSFGKGMRKIWDENYEKMLKENKVKYEL